MKRSGKNTLMVFGITLSLAIAVPMLSVHADDDDHDDDHHDRGAMIVNNPVVQQECGECHMVYPPRLLSSGAWSHMMNDLSNHFGEDASLDEATRGQIENYLVQNGSRRGNSNTLRISEQRWFVGEHRGEVSRWQMDKAKTWANCQACHPGATRGYFDDD